MQNILDKKKNKNKLTCLDFLYFLKASCKDRQSSSLFSETLALPTNVVYFNFISDVWVLLLDWRAPVSAILFVDICNAGHFR